jgi:predicted nucleotidyltransferase
MAPQQRWYLRDIARRTGLALGTVRRELAGLVAAGILTQVKEGNRTYYQANAECPLLSELTGLIRKTAGLADVLGAALAPLADRVALAFIYGSQASGTAGPRSDVDLLVVSDADQLEVHKAVAAAEKQLQAAVNYTLLTSREFARRKQERAGFLARVLGGPKILLVGGLNEVR